MTAMYTGEYVRSEFICFRYFGGGEFN